MSRNQNAPKPTNAPDDFWDIESLLPQKKPSKHMSPPSRANTETTEIEFDPPTMQNSLETSTEGKLPLSKEATNSSLVLAKKALPPEPQLRYQPHHPLISEVRIYPWRSNFGFYERFCAMANNLYDRHGSPCASVPFFSYMPQYDQMNRAQLDWYLYWRDCVRSGEYPDTDYSYIFLYLFEIINLTDRIAPIDGQRQMCEIWRRYRKAYPLLNRYLADWICDYSLIHRISPPAQTLADLLPVIAENSSFKEFYACPTGNDTAQDSQIYLTFCTNYEYRKSKLYLAGKAQACAMNEHIPAAISIAVQALEEQNISFATTKMQKATLSRDSFIGALCSGHMKRRIEVDYCSFNRSHELRFLITDIIKYTENKLRGLFGMKSKLSVYALPDQVKAILDEYFAQVFPSKRKPIMEERPAYEALYDLPTTELSLSHAEEIEQSSWDVTRQLVEAFEEPQPEAIIVEQEPPQEAEIVAQDDTDLAVALKPYAALLCAIDRQDMTQVKEIARQLGKLPDALVEEINTLASDVFGDILIEENEYGGYAMIEDYREEIASLLKQ